MIRLRCSGCKALLSVPESARGKRIKCPRCTAVTPMNSPPPRETPAHRPEPPPQKAPARPAGKRPGDDPGRPGPAPAATPKLAPPSRGKLGLWIGLAAGAGVGLLAGVVLAGVLLWQYTRPEPGPVAQGPPEPEKPKPSEPGKPDGKSPPGIPEKFKPRDVVASLPADKEYAMRITTDPGTVRVVNPADAREISGYSRNVTQITPLPEGDRCVCLVYGKASVWNYRTGKKEKDIPLSPLYVSGVEATGDSKRLLFVCTASRRKNGLVVAWDMEQGRELWRTTPVKRLAPTKCRTSLSPDEKALLVSYTEYGFKDGLVQVLDMETGRPLLELRGEMPDHRITHAAWHPGGRQLLLARAKLGLPDRITALDLETRQEVPFLDIALKPPFTIRYWGVSPDKKHLLLVGGRDRWLVDTSDASVLWRTAIERIDRVGVTFSRDSRLVACDQGKFDRNGNGSKMATHILDARSGREAYRLVGASEFKALAFAPDRSGVIAAIDNRLLFYPLPKPTSGDSPELPGVLPSFPGSLPPAMTITTKPGSVPVVKPEQARVLSNERVRSLALLPDKQECACVKGRNEVLVVNSRTGRKVKDFRLPAMSTSWVRGTADGKRLFFHCRALSGGPFLLAWDPEKDKELWRFPDRGASEYFPGRVALSPEGERVLVFGARLGSAERLVAVLDLATGRPLWQLEEGKTRLPVANVLWHPDGRRLFLAREDAQREARQITTMDLESKREVPYLGITRKDWIPYFYYWQISPDGKRLFLRTGREAGLVDLATRKVLWRTVIETMTHAGSAFSPDGRWVACWGGASRGGKPVDCFVHILDARTGKEVCRLEGPTAFDGAAFTPDGKGVLTTSRRLAYYPLPKLD